MRKPIMDYWPPYYEHVREFIELAKTEDAELQLTREAMDRLFDDRFVMTSGVEAIKRREKMLGIQADPATESLDFRRARIVNRYSTKPPFTIRYLQERLDRLVGAGLTIATVDAEQLILQVTTNIEDAYVFRETQWVVETVKPANLVYQQNTSVGDRIGLEERISMQAINWQLALGTWALGQAAFATLGPEVEIA